MRHEIGQSIGLFVGLAGFVGVIVQLLTAPEPLRNLSFVILFLSLILLGFWLLVFNSWKRSRASRALPNVEQLDDLSVGYVTTQATLEEIDWIARLEEKVYTNADAVPKSVLTEWYEANPNGFSVIRMCSGQKIGHIDLLPIKPNTLQRFIAGQIVERDIRGDSLYGPDDRGLITNLYVESIILLPPRGFTNAPAILCVLSSFAKLVERVCDTDRLVNIYAIAASKSGERLMKRLGFDSISPAEARLDRHELYSANFKHLARNIATICGTHFPDTDTLGKILEQKVEDTIPPSS